MVVRACNPSYSEGWGRRIAWTQEVEVAVSRDRNKSETPSQKKEEEEKKEGKKRKMSHMKTGYILIDYKQ